MRQTNDPKTILIRLAIVVGFALVGVCGVGLFHTYWAALPVFLIMYGILQAT
jgi:hypothetical protein